jgi:hypothetical protein
VNNTTGTIIFSVGNLDATTVFTGSGTLATIKFRPVTGATGTVAVNFSPAPDTKIVDSLGASVGSSTNNSFQIASDTTAPPAPTLTTPVNYINSLTPVFSWSAVTDTGSGLKNYVINVATNTGFTAGLQTASPTTNSYNGFTLTNGTTYYWQVQAVDNVNNQSAFSSTSSFVVDTTSPPTPTGLTPAAGTNYNVRNATLGWTAVTDTGGSGLKNYNVEVSNVSTFASGVTTYNPTTNSQPVTVTGDGTWYWRVRAVDNANNNGTFSANSNFISDMTPPGQTTLSSPTDLAVLGSGTVNLSWVAVTDATSGIKNYELQTAVDSAFTTTLTATTHITAAATRTMADGAWFWRVRAVDNANNNGTYSVARSFTVDTARPSAISNLTTSNLATSSVTLNWSAPNANPGTAVSYEGRYATVTLTDANFATTGTVISAMPVPAAAGTAQTVTVSGLTSGTTYYFAIRSSDQIGPSLISNVALGTTTMPVSTMTFSVKVDGTEVTSAGRANVNVELALKTAAGALAGTFNGAMVYNSVAKTYSLVSPMTLTGVVPGSYRMYVKGFRQLRKETTGGVVVAVATGPNSFDWTSQILLGGDASGDNYVDAFDFVPLANDYRSPTATNSQADFNMDGIVDAYDFVILARNYRVRGDSL